MSKKELERFRAEIQEKPGLLQELMALAADPEALVRWTAERGYNLTHAEVQDLANSCGELSDEELDQAAGGWSDPPPTGTGGGGGG